MSDAPSEDRPQICLITPPSFDTDSFADILAAALDAAPVACLRLALASRDEYEIGRAADLVRQIAHERDIPVVIEAHLALVGRHGLDGIHLPDGARHVRAARKELGADAIVGAACGATRHEGINAGEAGADYVSFGPAGATTLGTADPAPFDLFEWWSQVIEVPVIAEGALDEDLVRRLAPVTDFFAFGPEIWSAEDPAAALRDLDRAIG